MCKLLQAFTEIVDITVYLAGEMCIKYSPRQSICPLNEIFCPLRIEIKAIL